MTVPDTSALPAADAVALDALDGELDVAPGGVLLGAGAGGPVTVPAFAARALRLVVVGEPLLGALLALRFAAVGAGVTVGTARPAAWGPLRAPEAAGVARVVDGPHRWAPPPAGAPGAPPGPQVLLVDVPAMPPAHLVLAPWQTLVQLTAGVPPPGACADVDAVVVVEPGHGPALDRALGVRTGDELGRLRPGDVAVVGRGGTRVGQIVLGPAERRLLRLPPA